jgi:predicted aldo/keto reductase-like oxidoreductase
MQRVTLGRTGLSVTELGFGALPIQRLTDEGAAAVINRCLDLGINFIDTAHAYTNSEGRVGAAIAGRRESLMLASKAMAATGDEAQAQLDLSFQRLGVDFIDLYQLHNVSTEDKWAQQTAPGGPLDVLREAQQRGRIGHIGISSHQEDIALKAVRSGFFETILFPFNFMAPEPATLVREACRDEGVAFLAMKPMGGGTLANARVAFRYLQQFPDVVPVVGIDDPPQIEEIVALYEHRLPLTDVDRQEMEQIRAELGTSFCRRCDYCQPCREGIQISVVMNAPSAIRRMPFENVIRGFGTAVEKVPDCQDCGDCESRCPYGLSIRKRMQEVYDMYTERVRAHRAGT